MDNTNATPPNLSFTAPPSPQPLVSNHAQPLSLQPSKANEVRTPNGPQKSSRQRGGRDSRRGPGSSRPVLNVLHGWKISNPNTSFNIVYEDVFSEFPPEGGTVFPSFR